MLIRSVRLNDYRNYVRGVFTFDPHLNIIVGKNGTGKTNLLESIVVVSNTKSYRTNDDRDLIRKGREFARIELNSDENEFRVVINKKGKSLFIDGTLIRKTSDFIGRINAVLFKPSDLELFTQSPGERRKLLDIEISKVSRRYIDALLKYNRLLKDKNKLLKENEPDKVLMSVINESMVPLIKTIIEEREGFFEVINEYISPMYAMISGKEVKIEIRYHRCSAIDEVEKKIEQTREKDLYYHYATYGTHHEDYDFLMDGYDLNSIASQGQKRMVLIAFKFALIKYIQKQTGQTPVVLLDDILSELDKDNQERLLNVLPLKTQVIITNTDINNLNIDKTYKLITLKEEEDV
jgi:DNA replication and repair protein RecF